jgi:riboflavin biosynthesis pyrimidine reductase
VNPLELLFAEPGLEAFDLPSELETFYGGPFGIREPYLVTNFVSTLDGVTAIAAEPRSNRLISGGSEADRFVMGLLRACAGAVLIGSGTLQGSPTSIWTAERAFPPAAAAFAELRRRLGLQPMPELAVLTGSGSIDPGHPALEAGALVLATEAGASRLGDRLPAGADVVVVGEGAVVDPRAAVDHLRARGHVRILSEAGPHVFGSLLAAGLVDEVFLTLSPLLAGRPERGGRLGLVEGRELLPGSSIARKLLSLRRDDSFLFLRYGLRS